MIYNKLNFSEIPGFSKLFIDFSENDSFFNDRFPSNELLFNNDDSLLNSINRKYLFNDKYNNRINIFDSIAESMSSLELSDEQTSNLELLLNNNTFVIATGQQVGFLGGPLYTLLKAFDTIILANKLKQIHTENNFIPVFWLENNDHDSAEASTGVILTKEGTTTHFACTQLDFLQDRISVSEKVFDNVIDKVIGEIIEKLPPSEYYDEIKQLITSIYYNGNLWDNAFLDVIQWLLGSYGILFLKASVARKAGLFKRIIQREIRSIGESSRIINEANKVIESNGYHIQAKSSTINLFYHFGKFREKVKISDNNNQVEIKNKVMTKEELEKLSESAPEGFSPNVLLRPIIQDSILPVVAYIAGPSEIGYLLQTKELYQYYGIQMPAVIARHSTTILDSKTIKHLKSDKLVNIADLYNNYHDIENKYSDLRLNHPFYSVFRHSEECIAAEQAKIIEQVANIDKSLVASAEAHFHKIKENLSSLEKRVSSSIKKSDQTFHNRLERTWNLIYPGTTLQERSISIIGILALIGKENLLKSLTELADQSNEQHIFIDSTSFD